jgi:hypothetical protein
MTRDEALNAVIDRIDIKHGTRANYTDWADSVIKPLEALGLVKFDEPLAKTHYLPTLSFASVNGTFKALVREDVMIETLCAAGYTIKHP